MSRSVLFALDLFAILVLTFALYFPRHRRKDMLVAYLGVNIGVLAVTNALGSASVGAGLGLGLFGVLSIIRLRSEALDHEEVAYYFAALAMGLLGGFEVSPAWLSPSLMVALLGGLYLGDHPALFRRYRLTTMTLDQAFTNEVELKARLEELLTARVHRIIVRSVDLVRDTTTVEVRYELGEGQPRVPSKPMLARFGNGSK